jgi:small-conductance mechanosensitive channel/CRP-like cAMP-binding protein
MLGRWLKRQMRVPLGWSYQLFIVTASIFAASACLSMTYPGLREIGLIALISAAFSINALFYRFVWPIYGYPGEKAKIPGFLPQVVGILLVLSACFVGLALFYQVTIPGLLAGSGVIAIIIGLALQDTLGNIFAGFGLQAGQAYKVGDWLLVEGRHVEVVEINWRSTRLRNNDDVSFNIPNSQLAKDRIVNLYYPTPLHAMRVRIAIDHRVPPNEVKEALMRAAVSAPGVLPEPPPRIFLIDYAESAIQYEIKFWLNDGRRFPEIIDSVRTNAWYELERRDIRLAFPRRMLQVQKERASEPTGEQLAAIITQQPLFEDLDPEEGLRVAAFAHRVRFGRNEMIIRQGDNGESMFILLRGTASVEATRDGVLKRVAELRPGDCFGEMSLLTGEPRSATVSAKTDCEVLEIPKPAVAEVLRTNPELAERFSEVLVSRRQATEAELQKVTDRSEPLAARESRETFLRRLRQFFEL